ncbi:unnamed protein product [Choristocarpus tenellus]
MASATPKRPKVCSLFEKEAPRTRKAAPQAASSRINAANADSDLSTGVEALLSFDLAPTYPSVLKVKDASLVLEFLHSRELSDSRMDDIYGITRGNMQVMYEEAGWGWVKEDKMNELKHEDARFLIARGADGQLAGFSSFRFMWDGDEGDDVEDDVLYVYELQLDPWAKRRGLGRRMMQTLELLANCRGMSKLMLTVLKLNKTAMSFYRHKMGYNVDPDSPSLWGQDDEPYEILSKATKHGLRRAEAKRTRQDNV